MCDQKMQDPGHLYEPFRSAVRVDNRHPAVTAMRHFRNRRTNRVIVGERFGMRGHDLLNRNIEIGTRSHQLQRIAFCKDTIQASLAADQNCAAAVRFHAVQDIPHRTIRFDTDRLSTTYLLDRFAAKIELKVHCKHLDLPLFPPRTLGRMRDRPCHAA